MTDMDIADATLGGSDKNGPRRAYMNSAIGCGDFVFRSANDSRGARV